MIPGPIRDKDSRVFRIQTQCSGQKGPTHWLPELLQPKSRTISSLQSTATVGVFLSRSCASLDSLEGSESSLQQMGSQAPATGTGKSINLLPFFGLFLVNKVLVVPQSLL